MFTSETGMRLKLGLLPGDDPIFNIQLRPRDQMKYTPLLPKTDGFQLYKQNTMHALLSKCAILLASQLIDRTVDWPTITELIPRQCFEFRVGCQLFWLSAANPRLSSFLSSCILGAELTIEKHVSQPTPLFDRVPCELRDSNGCSSSRWWLESWIFKYAVKLKPRRSAASPIRNNEL